MLKLFFDWSGVIALAIAFVHFIFPEIGVAMGRGVLNRFAKLSKANTERRIQKLQMILATLESLTPLTEFEETVLHGLSGICMLITILPIFVGTAYLLAFVEPNVSLIAKEFMRQLIVPVGFGGWAAGFSVVYVLIGLGINRFLTRFRLSHSKNYKITVQKNIDELKARLN